MSKDNKWRVRDTVGRLLPHLAEAMGIPFFEEHLLQPWLILLLDCVANVCISCVKGMPKLSSVAGTTWIQSDLLPQFTALYDDSLSYLTRITIIWCYACLCETTCEDEKEIKVQDLHPQLLESIVTFILKGLNDKVQMVSARGLQDILDQCKKEVRIGRIELALRERIEWDEDEDCKYFALNCSRQYNLGYHLFIA